MKHVHHDLIVEWANGSEIQFFNTRTDCWEAAISPQWTNSTRYRVKNIHQELMDLHAKGALIQFFDNERWFDVNSNLPLWDKTTKYRVKPEPKPDVVLYGCCETYVNSREGVCLRTSRANGQHLTSDNLILTFDGETGKLKSAEVI